MPRPCIRSRFHGYKSFLTIISPKNRPFKESFKISRIHLIYYVHNFFPQDVILKILSCIRSLECNSKLGNMPPISVPVHIWGCVNYCFQWRIQFVFLICKQRAARVIMRKKVHVGGLGCPLKD